MASSTSCASSTTCTRSADFDKIPPDVDVLMMVHPQHLPDKTLYAIDQFVLRGGRALVFVDPIPRRRRYSRASSIRPAPPTTATRQAVQCLGRHMVPKIVAGDRDAAQVNAGTDEHGIAVDYVAWLT